MPNFDEWFQTATGSRPFPYQRRLAGDASGRPCSSQLVHIPTGAGKTEAVLLAWLWNRVQLGREDWPRRLVYCLPMRVLVEQTQKRTEKILKNLGLYAERPSQDRENAKVCVHVLMGGEVDDDWDTYPERKAILIGTQDMLLSRAINRGYAMSRYRWPVHFGLLNNEALWVIDEVQLFGAGLATTAQLQAFRRQLGTFGSTRTLWMSATMEPSWLETIDVDPSIDTAGRVDLDQADREDEQLRARLEAVKALKSAKARMGESAKLAEEIAAAHRPATRTLAVVNTVTRAVALYDALRKKKIEATLVLVHSRFRPPDRQRKVEALLASPGEAGTIVVSTQVLEAGVDVSATTLFTELAPWPSLVQRFGRCNRRGDERDAAAYWIDFPVEEKEQGKFARPYDVELVLKAREALVGCGDVGPSRLPRIPVSFAHGQIVRRKDLIELFDTTPDLAGHDVDVSRFVRVTADLDVSVFWREGEPGENEPEPARQELCAAPLTEIRDLIKKNGRLAWWWDHLEERWAEVHSAEEIYPGLMLRLRAEDGGYSEEHGWISPSTKPVSVIHVEAAPEVRGYDGDPVSEKDWKTLRDHTEEVVQAAQSLAEAIGLAGLLRIALVNAARWHDAGKAHPVFQESLRGGDPGEGPPGILAKTARRKIRHARPCFRHELASGVLALMHGQDDLVAYLAAAHHGKVRLSIRSLSKEKHPPDPSTRFARGIWEGDEIQEADLGGGVVVPATMIDLSFMELGDGPRGRSWLAHMLALRDDPHLGPFRLAFLEALIKAADERASGGLL